MTEPQPRQTPYTTLNVDKQLYNELVEIAQRNDRTTSAEARIAIRRHLQTEKLIRHDPGWNLNTEPKQ